MRKFFINLYLTNLFIGCLFTIPLMGAISSGILHQAANGWIRTQPGFIAESAQALPVPQREIIAVTSETDGSVLAYAFNLKPRGYIVLAADDRIFPVIAWSVESGYYPDDVPENGLLRMLRIDIPERLHALRDGVVSPQKIAAHQKMWRSLSQAGDPARRSLNKSKPARLSYDVEHGPFLSSLWGQDTHNGDRVNGYPVWNYYTPPHDEDSPNNYVSGCVATAMAQVLNYYEWPPTGANAHAYLWDNGSDTQTLSVDFGAVSYDWHNMLDSYASVFNDANRRAAGLLTYHCGVSVNMHFTYDASGAASGLCEPALNRFFRMHAEFVDSADTFYSRLYQNMINGRPAILSMARDPSRGHSVVADGVRHNAGDTLFFHLNFGWRGYNNGWYYLEQPIVTSAYTYHLISDVILDILPTPVLDDVEGTVASPDITLNWQASDRLNATFYDIEYARLQESTTTYYEDWNTDLGDWLVNGNWTLSSIYMPGSESTSIRGYTASTETDSRIYSTLTLNKAVIIEASTTIGYYWASRYFHETEARFEISMDGFSWETLRVHAEENTGSPVWHADTVVSGELSAYHGAAVALRFVIDLTPGPGYFGTGVGFFLEDLRIQDARFGEWVAAETGIAAESADITLVQNGDHAFRTRAYADGAWRDYSNFTVTSLNAPELYARVFLEGAYASGTLSTHLKTNGYIPNGSPYAEAPVYCETIPDTVTDWALVELRASPSGPALDRKSAFISQNGFLCNTTGRQGVVFDVTEGAYYVVIRHRNHVDVMSAGPVNVHARH